MNEKFKRVLTILWMFLTPYFFISNLLTYSQPSWNSQDWAYRRAIAVSNSTGNLLTNFQIKVTLNNSFDFNHCKTDGSDLRFTSSDALTLIPYWIEDWNPSGTSATIWVKVSSLPTSGTQIFMYYGNSSATNIQDGNNVFEFFDNFESAYESPWVENAQMLSPNKADGTAAVYNGELYVFGGYGFNVNDNLNDTYKYNPLSNTWTKLANMPTKRWGPIAVEFNGKIHVFAGGVNSAATSISKHEIYDPATDTWQSNALANPLNIPKYGGATGVVHPDVIYFSTGRDGYKYWMTYTPYPPQSNENPSVVRSNDGITWTDAGISNPVIQPGSPGSWNDLENPDPDMIYVADLDKWFMVWDGGDAATNSRKIALAYSSDGKTWTEYNGTSVNGNNNPVILSGDDSNGQAWERSGSISKTCTPTLFYASGTFYLYYAEEASGNNRGAAGFATFTWNNSTNSVQNLTRYSGNPTINLPQDAVFKSGGGHLDISYNSSNGLYYMYLVRELVGSANYELSLLTSTDMINWTNNGNVLQRGSSGQWDDTHIYRSSPVVTSNGNIVITDNKIRVYYSAYNSGGNIGIGIADLSATNPPVKFVGGPSDVPAGLANQGLMAVKYGSKIHLFYRSYHYEYDPATDIYVQKADVPTQRTWSTCAVVNDKIYLIGGYSYATPSGATNVNEVYDPATDTWTTKAPMPISKYGATRENPVINGKIYITHGLNGGFHVDNYVYDPATDTWTQKAAATHPRDGVECGIIDNKLYVVGGRDVSGAPFGVPYNEVYDPMLDTGNSKWAFSNPLRVRRDQSAKYEGNYGLVVENDVNVEQYALHTQSFGKVAVDIYWNITTAYGINDANLQPQGRIVLSGAPADGSLYFYQQSGAPRFRWYNGSLNHLQDGNWNTWNKVTIIRDGVNSKVQINGTTYPVTCAATNTDRVFLGIFWPTREFFDLVRVRKYSDPSPTFAIDVEQQLHFTITATSGSGGLISPSGSVLVNYGDNQTFTISPTVGYHTTDVLVDGTSVGAVASYTFNNVTANHTISTTFAITTYTITATAGANGTVTPSGITTVNYGGSQTYTIAPNSGYQIVDVLVDGSSVGAVTNYAFNTTTANHTISASFNILAPTPTHYVSLSGTNISPYSSSETAATNIQSAINAANSGDLILVAEGTYTLTTNISVTKSVTIRSVNGNTLTTVDGNLVAQCFFINDVNAVVDGFTIKNGRNTSGYGGGVQCDNGTVQNCIIENNAARDGGGVALNNSGMVINCIIRNNTADWGGGVRCFNGTVRGCLITGNTATPHGGGINIWSGGTVQNCTITNNTATDGSGIRLWNNGIVENSIIYFNNGSSNYIIDTGTGNSLSYSCTTPSYTGTGNIADDPQFVNTGTGDYHLMAASTLINAGSNQAWMTGKNDLGGNNRINGGTVDIGAYEYTVTNFSINASVVGSGGVISPLGNVTVSSNSNQTFTISPNVGNHIVDVLVDGISVGAVTSYTFTNVTANHTISASFAVNIYTLTITSVNGTVTKNPDQANYSHGSTVQLTATPASGYIFTGWSGDATGSANPLTVTMEGNRNITANFAINTYTLTITSVNGTVAKNPDQANYASGSTVQLTAVPTIGYIFTGWSGDATGSTNPLTVTMNSNKNITAEFAIDNNSYIEIGSASALAGSSITIPVRVHLGGGTNIPKYILQGKIIFDPENLKYRISSIGSLFTAMGWTFTGYSTVAGQFDFIATGYSTISTDGILFNLNFDVISNTSGTTQITSLPSYWLSNNSNTPVLFSAINTGTISITSQSSSAVVGDVDGNFKVDFNDAIAIINHVLNIFPLQGQSLINADVDNNGNITLADAIGVILYCTFGDWNYSLSILSPLTNAYLSVDNPVVNNSGVVLPLDIKNADNVRSLEVTVVYDPQEFTYDSFSAGINSSNAITKASQVSPGQAKFVFTSNELINKNFSAGSITLRNNNGIFAGGGFIKTSYKINDGNEVAGASINTGTTGIENDYGNEIPSKFELVQNYPNPFNPSTNIEFGIPQSGKYVVRVFNILGQTVRVLADKEFSAGYHKVTFEANDLASGIYIYQLFGEKVNLIKKMMLVK